MIKRQANHDAGALRFRVSGERGWVELVIEPHVAAVCFPVPGEDIPDCEINLGMGIAATWRAADQDDEVIWVELERLYARNTAEVHEVDLSSHPAGPQLLAELREAAAWANTMAELGTEQDYERAAQAHIEVLRRVVDAVQNEE